MAGVGVISPVYIHSLPYINSLGIFGRFNMFAQLKKYLPSQIKEETHLVHLIEQDKTLEHTPDVMLLEQKADQIVFLYCDKQTRHPRPVEGMEMLWEGYT